MKLLMKKILNHLMLVAVLFFSACASMDISQSPIVQRCQAGDNQACDIVIRAFEQDARQRQAVTQALMNFGPSINSVARPPMQQQQWMVDPMDLK